MRIEEKIMPAIGNFVYRARKVLPVIGLVILVASFFAMQRIELKTRIQDLLPEDNQMVKSFDRIDREFAGGHTILVTVEGTDKAEMIECANALAEVLRDRAKLGEYIQSVDLYQDTDFFRKWSFILQEAEDIEDSKQMFSGLNMLPFLTSLNDSFEETYMGGDAEEELSTKKDELEAVNMLGRIEDFTVTLTDYLSDPNALPLTAQGETLADTFMFGDGYTFSPDGKMLLFSFSPKFSRLGNLEKGLEMMRIVKNEINRIEKQFPGTSIGYTGGISVDSDEEDALSSDMLIPPVIALVIILLLFLFSFRPIRTMVLTVLTLVVGIVFNYGLIGITIREISMLTSFMATLLLGLGIDYGIQITTNFNAFRKEGLSPKDALIQTYEKAGAGTMLAAATTIVAFLVMALTGSRAFAQFGFSAAIGIFACFLVMFFILPALLLVFGKKNVKKPRLPEISYGFLSKISLTAAKHKTAFIILAVCLTAGLSVSAVLFNRFETDLMNLEPPNMTSIVTMEKLDEKFGIGNADAMVIANDLEEAREFTEKLEKVPQIVDVNSLAQYVPSEEEQRERLKAIQDIRTMPVRYNPDYRYTEDTVEQLAYEVQRLEWNIIEMADLSVAGLGEDNMIMKKRDTMIREILGAETGKAGKEVFQTLKTLLESDPSLYSERMTRLDAYFARSMNGIVTEMASVDRMITLDDLPEQIVEGMLHKDGKQNLVITYPEASVIDHTETMNAYSKALSDISPRITGTVQFITEWTKEVVKGSKKAALYIFIAVLLFMLIDFRSIRYAFIASVPLFLGMVWMLGVYPLLGQKFNPINIAVVPLVIGMGIDFGIHLTHRYMIDKNLSVTYGSTGKAVFLSALTTMIGFGSLALAGKMGFITSMGSVLFWGITMCLVTALIVLPALLPHGKTN